MVTGVGVRSLIALTPLSFSAVTVASSAASLIACCAFANSSLTLRSASAFSSLVNAALDRIAAFLVSAACSTAAFAAGFATGLGLIPAIAFVPFPCSSATLASVPAALIAFLAAWTALSTCWIAFAFSSAVNSLLSVISRFLASAAASTA